MQGCLDRIAALLMPPADGSPPPSYGALVPWWNLRYEHTVALRGVLDRQTDAKGRKWSPSHVNKHLSALRGVIRECWRLGYQNSDERDRAIDIENVAGKRLKAGRHVPQNEIDQLIAACEADPNEKLGIRDAAIISLLKSTGARRAEVAALLIEEYDHAERSTLIPGKGSKEREGYLYPAAAQRVDRWIAVVGQRHGPLFRPVDRHGNIAARALSARAIGLIVHLRQDECKLKKPVSTHDMRRTFVSDMLDAGNDLATVQELAGHASPATTSAYDRRKGRQRRAAVDKLSMSPATPPASPPEEPAVGEPGTVTVDGLGGKR